jgi:tetratricopeptide (TPR) repeat protein
VSREADAWRRKARAFQTRGDLPAAFDACQTALSLEPQSLETVHLLADIAFRIGQFDMAAKFYAHLMSLGDDQPMTVRAYAEALREAGQVDAAIDVLKPAVAANPTLAPLWETLGTTMVAKGDRTTALIFLDEALRLDPANLHARFHRGAVRFDEGDVIGALDDVTTCAKGFKDPVNRASAELTAAHMTLGTGDLAAGWRWYEGRHKRGTLGEVDYVTRLPRWKSGRSLAGKRLFISAEQGLGDEVLFASLLPDILSDIADGHIGLAVEPRLVPLFQRSFPDVTMMAHRTQTVDGRLRRTFPDLKPGDYDAWALLGDFLPVYRNTIDAFPARDRFLTPDPGRIANWRSTFAGLGPGPKVGVLWKSLKSTELRDRYFSPFTHWRDVLTAANVRFVNIQYGDTSAEMAEAKASGLDIATPEGIDLKDDLDDLAALTAALDLVIGPANATSNIAAAVGTPIFMLMPPRAWLMLGRDDYPWYPKARTFVAPTFGDWETALADMKAALLTL